MASQQTNRGNLKRRRTITRKFDKPRFVEILENRQVATTAIGGFLLLSMFVILVVAVFLKMIKPDVLASAFTLILGYFFGHIGSR